MLYTGNGKGCWFVKIAVAAHFMDLLVYLLFTDLDPSFIKEYVIFTIQKGLVVQGLDL